HPRLHWCRGQACASCRSEDEEAQTDFKSLAVKVCRLCFVRDTEQSTEKVAELRLPGILHSCQRQRCHSVVYQPWTDWRVHRRVERTGAFEELAGTVRQAHRSGSAGE